MALRKTEKANLRSRYPLYIEIGLVAALLVLILAFKVDWRPSSDFEVVMDDQEIVQIEEVQQTRQEVAPPPPPAPPVPIEVPNDEILDDTDLNLDASLDLNAPAVDLPPPPPPPKEEKKAAPPPEPEVFVIVENMPEMIPNQEKGMKQLNECIKYPEIARKAGVEGRVFVQFVVDEQGRVTDPVVTRGIGAGADEEALRCVRMVKFKPGKQRGKPVRVKMSLPVTFKLK